jgi:hypothetical protein
MSKILPGMGANGTSRAVFQSNKDQAGILSQLSAGRGWVAWSFEAEPANADLLVQFLADEALRPTWPRSEILPNALEKANRDMEFIDAVEEAVYNFKIGAGDPNVPQLPQGPIDQDQFVAIWAANLRRPEKACLQISGDLESISVVRLTHQHFGPWEGVRPEKTGSAPKEPEPPKRAMRPLLKTGAPPEVWAGWNMEALSPGECKVVAALIPWLLRATMPAKDEIIGSWEIGPGGRWLRAIGYPGAPAEELEHHITSLINSPLSQESLDSAIEAMNDYSRANALYPARALMALGQEAPIEPPALDDLQKALSKCMQEDGLMILVLEPGILN